MKSHIIHWGNSEETRPMDAGVVRNMSPGLPELTLLARCRAGESLAWKSLYEAHFDFIYRVARRLGTPEEEAEDVCQEVFMVAYRRFSTFTDGRLTTWLYRITANVASARHRKRRVREMFQKLFGRNSLLASNLPDDEERETGHGRSPERELEDREREEGVRRIIERMAPKKREVFALHEL